MTIFFLRTRVCKNIRKIQYRFRAIIFSLGTKSFFQVSKKKKKKKIRRVLRELLIMFTEFSNNF